MNPRPVALLTDFGLTDEYVGVMKGVLLTLAPGLTIVDLSHGIRPGDVRQAALLLAAGYRYFPDDTVYVCVVDPGVGSDRRIVALKAGKRIFLAPDNGLLTPILAAEPDATARQVTRADLFLPAVSSTFHGRDIFAPTGARLAGGLPVEEVGPPVTPASLLTLPMPAARQQGGRLHGEIVAIDRFGNCATSIRDRDLLLFAAGKRDIRVHCHGWTIDGLSPHYRASGEGAIALINSRGVLEIAVANGNAASLLGLAEGAPVVVDPGDR
ncbi:MAG: SAM-dependent chlorinase/fluorinase [Thermodesulfobacteriota bacterium]